MKILHLSTRFSSGGAAQVMQSLAEEQHREGHEVTIAFGFERGIKSATSGSIQIIRLTNRPSLLINYMFSRLLDREVVVPNARGWLRLLVAIQRSDVVHLHDLHSYFLPFRLVVRFLVRNRAGVVWTLHNIWLLTGRCAVLSSCQRSSIGCGHCPDLGLYPPTFLDRSRAKYISKRSTLNRLLRANPMVRFVTGATWLANRFAVETGHTVRVIPNPLDQGFMAGIKSSKETSGPTGGFKVIFVLGDMRDSARVNLPVLETLSADPKIHLTLVGDNKPESLEPQVWKPKITNRIELGSTLKAQDAMVYFSRKDVAPLTVIEGLKAGLQVHALDSQAVRDFPTHPRLHIYRDAQELLKGLNYAVDRGAGNATEHPFEGYEPGAVWNAYRDVYEEVRKPVQLS